MNLEDYDIAFQIIASAGNAKSSSMMAIHAAREGRFEDAKMLLEEADRDLLEAHKAQTQMLTEEARGNQVTLSVILVHAQDHLSGALLARDFADEFIELYGRLER